MPPDVPPSPHSRARASRLPGGAVALDVRALHKAYDVGPARDTRRHAVLRDVTLWIAAGECLAVVGGGLAPRTLLRCAAGLAHPTAGAIAWRDASGQRVAPPRRALVTADWCASAGCLTVGDVLEAAAPRALWQREADAHVRGAVDVCALGGALRRRVATLPPSERWLVGLGVAVASGARWLFVEPPPTRVVSRDATRARRDVATGIAARRRTALLALRASGRTVVASVVAVRAVPATRVLFWRDDRLVLPGSSIGGDAKPWRVAEPDEATGARRSTLPGGARAP